MADNYERLTVCETKNTESICEEITIKKRKRRKLSPYRLPNSNNNLKLFVEETIRSANQLLSKFDSIYHCR